MIGETAAAAGRAVRDVPEGGPGVARGHVSALGAYIARAGVSPLAVALTLFGVFLPVLVVPYAFSDDYPLLWMADGGGPSVQFGKTIIDAGAINGRPIAGLATQLFFSAANTIDH